MPRVHGDIRPLGLGCILFPNGGWKARRGYLRTVNRVPWGLPMNTHSSLSAKHGSPK